MYDFDAPRSTAWKHDQEWLPLDTARDCFALLVAGPDPISVDGRQFPGLPDRPVPLDEVRDRLLATRCSGGTRDAVWRHVIKRARAEGDAWTVGCVGMALPTLARSARRFACHYRGVRADLHAAVLAGFLDELAVVDLDQPAISQQLRWAAFRAGHAAVTESLNAPIPAEDDDLNVSVDALPPVGPGFRSSSPRRPWGHPDLVLARAVADEVLTATEAELIGATRLDDVSLTDWAEQRGMTTSRVNLARWRAEQRLVAYLQGQGPTTEADDPVESQALTSVSLRAATPAPITSAESSPTVSGRGRNGRPARTRTSSRGVKETDAQSRLLLRRGSAPASTHPTTSESTSEVRRCA